MPRTDSDRELLSRIDEEAEEMGLNEILEIREQMEKIRDHSKIERSDENTVRTVITNSSR